MRKLRPGMLGLLLAGADAYRRLTPKQRKQLLGLVREHGPKVARFAADAQRRRRKG